jgi:hypothetical protein
MEEAIRQVLARHETSMVTRWCAVIEVANVEGPRGLWCLTPDGTSAWDTLGMLEYAKTLELAALVRPDE